MKTETVKNSNCHSNKATETGPYRGALGRVYGQQPLDHFDRRPGYTVPVRRREGVVPPLDLVVECRIVLIIERRETAQQDVQNHTKAPQVHLLAVRVALRQNLRRNVPRCTASGCHAVISCPVQNFCKTEVGEFDCVIVRAIFYIGCIKQIFRLQIAVHNSDRVQVTQRIENLTHKANCIHFSIVPSCYNSVEKFPPGHQFKHQIHL
mmetsp:Transcript_9502/g.27284  ORF Transcript_9502/g.27284 Transcript_9502/m.27284 type:complete len:207 (+) Transcript_9502:1070-1690(+)